MPPGLDLTSLTSRAESDFITMLLGIIIFDELFSEIISVSDV